GLIVLLFGCAAATQVQQGRMALLYGDPEVAIGSFQSAAESDPNSLFLSVLPQGIWTYVGRATLREDTRRPGKLWSGRSLSTKRTAWRGST
ncbi:MAG TPA: hypothetical protein VEG60_11415, partial [Candidatus Binatia bacterium]|nr:hypothetical protein [Candidatus Binatia bacterium]